MVVFPVDFLQAFEQICVYYLHIADRKVMIIWMKNKNQSGVRAQKYSYHTSFCNLFNAVSLSLALINTYILPTSGFVLKIFSIRTDTQKNNGNQAQN